MTISVTSKKGTSGTGTYANRGVYNVKITGSTAESKSAAQIDSDFGFTPGRIESIIVTYVSAAGAAATVSAGGVTHSFETGKWDLSQVGGLLVPVGTGNLTFDTTSGNADFIIVLRS